MATTTTSPRAAAAAAKRRVSEAGDALVDEHELDAIRSDISSLKDEVRGMLSQFTSYAREKGGEGAERATVLASKAGDELGDAKDYLEQRVREKPLTSIGVAALVGMMIASLRR